MEKLKLHSPDLVQENVEKIAALFPNCVTEARDPNGELIRAVDFDLLRQELSTSVVEGPRERYHLDWPGKREALLAANAPIAKTLRPCREESVDFDKTRNLFIEGDNLDALKLLQETYLNKVKMIYIDPPYNTGNEFIYDDNFAEGGLDFLKRSSQVDEEGGRLVANTESNGRFHSNWLAMMYPRLKLARHLLREDGVIFISIHDFEVANLKKLCDEIFGAGNFVGQITWKARVKPVNIGDAKYRPQKEVEYVLVYQKIYTEGSFYPLHTGGERNYPYAINGRAYRLATILKSNRGTNFRSTMSFPLGSYRPPEGQRWQAGEDVITQLQKDGYIEFREGTPFRRYFEDEEGAEHDPFYCFMEVEWSSTSEAGKSQLNELLGNFHGFDTVKPVRLVKTLVQSCTAAKDGHIVLDFFGGSGTTAQAVMEQNCVDEGNRKFILVQIAEPSNDKSGTPEYSTVSELSKDRIRRVGAQLLDKTSLSGWTPDSGFRVLKIDSTSMNEVYYAPDKVDQLNLLDQIGSTKPDRSPEDLLFHVLVDWGVDLDLPISKEDLGSKHVFFVDGNALAACFEREVTEELVKVIAKRKPLRAVFRDSGYGSDSVKINVEQIFKLLSPETEIKSI